MTGRPKIETLQELIDESSACAKEKGWDDEPRSAQEDLLLIHSEVSEACEDLRNNRAPDEVFYDGFGNLKPCGVPTELADVVIRVAHMAKKHGIDLIAAINIKAAYNRTRPIRHGGKRF